VIRWKSDEALLIYARLNDSERSAWVQKAQSALVDSKVAAFLPTIDGDAIVADLMQQRGEGAPADDDGDDEA